MTRGDSAFYVTGGTLRPDAPSYVERRADRELLDALLSGEFCYVLTSRQMGKSSLMVRTAQKLRAQHVRVVVLDLTSIGQNVTPEQWYDGLLAGLGRQLRLEDELEDYWKKNARFGPVQRFFNAIHRVVLAKQNGPLIIFVDELDVVRSLPFSTDEFFAAIRECFTRRTLEPELNRLTFCLLGVATPSDLIRDTRITPFNIGRRIELNDFTATEVGPLAIGLAPGSPRRCRAILARIFDWTHGHPYLTQLLCRAVSEHNTTTASAVDQICSDLLLTAAARERDDNLLFVRESILRSSEDRTSLLNLYGRIQRGQTISWDEANPLLTVLRLSGLVRVEEGRARTRNRIYERAFDADWIKAHMPGAERRGRRRAFGLGLATALGGIAVFVVGALFWRRLLDQDPPIILSRAAPPGTNAFYLYQAASRFVETNQLATLDGPNEPPATTIEEVLRLNTNVLTLVRIAFQYPCRFPARPWVEFQKDLVALFDVGRLLSAEAKLFEARGEWSQAARSSLDQIRFGQDLSRGTPIMGRYVSVQQTGAGVASLARVLARLDAKATHAITGDIDGFLKDTTDFTETLKEERIMVQTDFLGEFQRPNWRYEPAPFSFGETPEEQPEGLMVRWFLEDNFWEKLSRDSTSALFSWIHSKRFLVHSGIKFYDNWISFVERVRTPPRGTNGVPRAPFDPFLERTLRPEIVLSCWTSHLRALSSLRLLQTALALHRFQLERGHLPETLEELTPAFLERSPRDPFSPDESLKYRLNKGRVLLYSRGPNGIDDNGTPQGATSNGKDDILLRDLDLHDP